MKVKIFQSNYTASQDFEDKVNKWMEKEKPQVKLVEQSESMTGNDAEGSYNLTISIWYEPK